MIRCGACCRLGADNNLSGRVMAIVVLRYLVITSKQGTLVTFYRCAPIRSPRRPFLVSLMLQVMRFGDYAKYYSSPFRAANVSGSSSAVPRVCVAEMKSLPLIHRRWMTLSVGLRGMAGELEKSVPSSRSCKRNGDCGKMSFPGFRWRLWLVAWDLWKSSRKSLQKKIVSQEGIAATIDRVELLGRTKRSWKRLGETESFGFDVWQAEIQVDGIG